MSAITRAFRHFRTGFGISVAKNLTRMGTDEVIPVGDIRNILVRSLVDQRVLQATIAVSGVGQDDESVDPRTAGAWTHGFVNGINQVPSIAAVPADHDCLVTSIGMDWDLSTLEGMVYRRWNSGVVVTEEAIWWGNDSVAGGQLVLYNPNAPSFQAQFPIWYPNSGKTGVAAAGGFRVRLDSGAAQTVHVTMGVLSGPVGTIFPTP